MLDNTSMNYSISLTHMSLPHLRGGLLLTIVTKSL